jgi:UDP-GlcNAc:undecaprenyl-phosphate GlcNAc-1-phosphate transferase
MAGISNVGLALLLALVASSLLVPLSMVAGTKFALTSKPRLFGSSERSIPNIGGIAVAAAVAVSLVLTWGPLPGMGIVAVGGLLAIALGLADDRVTALQSLTRHRLALQIAIAIAAWVGGLRADASGPVGFLATVFVLVACMNAFNLLDNMDGVAGATGAAVGSGIAILAALQGQFLVASLAAAVAGACLGFLPFNFNGARVYLGNGGSLLLGFLLGGAALKLRLPLGQPWSILATVALLGVPATDTAVVMLSRLRHRRGILNGGTDHISHRLVRLGFTTSEAALIHGAVSLMAAGFGAFVILRGSLVLLAVPVVLLAVAGLALQVVPVYESEEAVGRTGWPVIGGASTLSPMTLSPTALPASLAVVPAAPDA